MPAPKITDGIFVRIRAIVSEQQMMVPDSIVFGERKIAAAESATPSRRKSTTLIGPKVGFPLIVIESEPKNCELCFPAEIESLFAL
jgi:hypothetical protein